jgi:8-amino-7-oxononanoate synthase
MLPWCGIYGPDVLVVSSMAKAFGVPAAVLAGCKAKVREFEEKSETRVHCSPASIATIHAAEHALETNARCGDRIRLQLARLVGCFRQAMAAAGFRFLDQLFPVQTLVSVPERHAAALHERLLRAQVSTVLHASHNRHGARISFLITAEHTLRDITRAVDALPEAGVMQTVNDTNGGMYEAATYH